MRKFFLTLLAFTAVISASATIVLPTTATQKLTLKGVVGQSVTITLGVYAPNDIYAVDFGDGIQHVDSVGWHNGGVRDENSTDEVPASKPGTTYEGATNFTGTVAGDGTIKIYGTSNLWMMYCTGGALPSSFDQDALAGLHEFKLTDATEESITLPAMPQLTQFSLTNSTTKTLDVSNATALTSLSVTNTSVAATDMQLESIDLTKNTKLENLILGGTFYKKGVLKTVDLSKNTALKQIVVANQDLTSITLPEGATLTNGINVAQNQLTALDLSKLASVKGVTANNNQLTAIDLSKLVAGGDLTINDNLLTELNVPVSVVNLYAQNNKLTKVVIADATKICKLENNCLTLASVPAQPAGLNTSKKTKNFTYAPQAAFAVGNSAQKLDLASLLTVAKGELNPAGYADWLNGTTTFAVKTAGGTALAEGTDYTVEDGKLTFLTAQADKVYVEMTNTALPKFTGANTFKTTQFSASNMPAVLSLTTTLDAWDGTLKVTAADNTASFTADMGDGNLVPVVGGTISGPALGEGKIVVYSDGDLTKVNASKVPMKSIDLSQAKKLTDLTLTQVGLNTVDVTKLTELVNLTFNNNPTKSMNLTKNTKLAKLVIRNFNTTASSMKTIDLSKNTELTTLQIYSTQNFASALETINLSANKKLTQVFLQYNNLKSITLGDNEITNFNVQNNQLTALDFTKLGKATDIFVQENKITGVADLSKNMGLKTVRVDHNELTGLKVGDVSNQLHFYYNNMSFATMPELPAGLVSKVAQFKYSPQNVLDVEKPKVTMAKNTTADMIVKGVQYDLSAQLTTNGIKRSPTTTTYSWHTMTGAILTEGVDYVEDNGVFTFMTAPEDSIFAVMLNDAFPEMIDNYGLQTKAIKINADSVAVYQPIVKLKATVEGEASVGLGVYDNYDVYCVDFDGALQVDSVGCQNGGIKGEDGLTKPGTTHTATTKFTANVKAGTVIGVYGKSALWYMNNSGGIVPDGFDQEGLKSVVQMNITGADMENVVLPETDKLTQFNFNNSSLKTIDVSKATALTSLSINSTTASKFEPQLESIDLSKNVNLESLNIQGNQNASGKLTSLDLTNNTKLKGMGLYVQYNQISDLKIGDNELTAINVQNNKLTSLDLTKLPKLKSLYAAANLFAGEFDLTAYETIETVQLNDNQLTGVKVNDVTKQFYVDGNKMTLATIPAQPAGMNTKNKTKQFKYAPQADLQVEESVSKLDLSAQLTVAKGELNPEGYADWLNGTTTFAVKTAAGTALTEGTDYSVEAGVISFLKNQTEKVYVEMLNTALPKFTAEAPFKTTAFTVSGTDGIRNIRFNNDGKIYNLQGVEVQNPTKGLYIQNGKVFQK